ncbi:aliphatic sulfonate ABC transporter substrate-binding protein [Actinoplanes sp. NPDC026619]|uniref:aliphatic sulfonate ABC transporter substrate-binding protein n=1 Tax=Actinoplanes sp. NPDC026619 TaxID=3155798 RepID=UPI003402B80E
MKRLLAAVAAASLLLLTACGSSDDNSTSGSSTVKVNFGYIGDYNGSSLLAVADDQKLWAKHGLEVSTKVFTNGPLQITAINAGDLDFGYIGPGAIWLPQSGKAKIVALNSLGNADRVIAQPGITDLAQLKGKKVGVPEGTSGDMILTLALKKAGLTNDDIQRVPMDASTIVAAFASGQIDVAGIWYPLLNNIKQKKPGLVELAKDSDFTDNSFPTAFVGGNNVSADKITKVVQVLREAMDYRAANPDKTVELVAALLKQPVDAVKADAANSQMLDSKTLDGYTADGTINKWLTGLGDYFVGAKKITSNPDPNTYYLGDTFTGAASK